MMTSRSFVAYAMAFGLSVISVSNVAASEVGNCVDDWQHGDARIYPIDSSKCNVGLQLLFVDEGKVTVLTLLLRV